MELDELIELCSNDEGEGWGQLWLTVESAALEPVRRQLHAWGFDPGRADDVMQELCLHLGANDLHRLRIYRGRTEAEFRSFLRRIAVWFTWKLLGRWDRERRREALAFRQSPPHEVPGATLEEFWSVVRELESIMPGKDRKKLRYVLRHWDLADPPRGPGLLPKDCRRSERWSGGGTSCLTSTPIGSSDHLIRSDGRRADVFC